MVQDNKSGGNTEVYERERKGGKDEDNCKVQVGMRWDQGDIGRQRRKESAGCVEWKRSDGSIFWMGALGGVKKEREDGGDSGGWWERNRMDERIAEGGERGLVRWGEAGVSEMRGGRGECEKVCERVSAQRNEKVKARTYTRTRIEKRERAEA